MNPPDFWFSVADIALTLFHTLLILFNLLGWIWQGLRKWHLVSLLLTFASWVVLGIWYGWGYCPFTDWHWQVLRQLGHTHLPASYISFLITRLSGLQLPAQWVDAITLAGATGALLANLLLQYFRKYLPARKK